jgi:tRNA(Arg) A34 adenosine deaminase TadA
MRRAIELSATALTSVGIERFGAVVIREGQIVGEGINRSLVNHDPTSNGEIEAIRDAGRNLGTVDLSGCELYTNCEPCPLCVAAMDISRTSRLYFAASLAQSDSAKEGLSPATRFPIDSEKLREACAQPVDAREMPAEQHLSDAAV